MACSWAPCAPAQVESLYEQGREGQRELAELRNVLFKRMTCHLCAESVAVLTIATLPFLYFASGHTFFTQSLQERMGFLPVCVHTTFQFGDTAEFTWGKRSRLREKRLWAVDDESYFRRRGAGPHPSEESYEGFLRLSGELIDFAQLGGRPLARRSWSTPSPSRPPSRRPSMPRQQQRSFGRSHCLRHHLSRTRARYIVLQVAPVTQLR